MNNFDEAEKQLSAEEVVELCEALNEASEYQQKNKKEKHGKEK